MTLILPGVGSVTLTVTTTGTIDTTAPLTITGQGTFQVSVAKVNSGKTGLTVTFVSPGTSTAPKEAYTIQVKIKPASTTNPTQTVTAIAGPASGRHGEGDDQESSEGAEHEDGATAGTTSTSATSMSSHHGDGGGDTGNHGNKGGNGGGGD